LATSFRTAGLDDGLTGSFVETLKETLELNIAVAKGIGLHVWARNKTR
jgi:hypothetical protein